MKEDKDWMDVSMSEVAGMIRQRDDRINNLKEDVLRLKVELQELENIVKSHLLVGSKGHEI